MKMFARHQFAKHQLVRHQLVRHQLVRHLAGCWMMLLMTVVLVLPAAVVKGQWHTEPQDKLIDWPMHLDPLLPESQSYKTFDERLASIWFMALNQHDSKTRFEAASAVASAARQGMQGLDIMTNRLTSLVASEKEHAMTRLACAKALIALDARENAKVLWAANVPANQQMVQLTDPVLARWGYAPAIESWRKRSTNDTASLFLRISAVQSLGVAKDKASIAALTTLVLDQKQSPALRLAAARSLASFASIHESAQGVPLPANAGLVDKLAVAYLLGAHDGAAATKQLEKLAQDAEPAVAVVAGQRLLTIKPQSLDRLVVKYSQSGDVKLRTLAVNRLAGRQEAQAISDMAVFLSDQDPELRVLARDKLIELASVEGLRVSVVKVLMSVLDGDSPLALEQAALAIGQVDVKEAASRLQELIAFDDVKVALSAATSLRKLEVAQTLEPALAYVKENMAMTTPYKQGQVASQLIQLLGVMKYEPAEATFRNLVPKNSGPSSQRTAAIWALGKMHEGVPDAALIRDLARRANDGKGMEPEDANVREQAVIAIGRMKDKRSVKVLQRWIDDDQDNSLAIPSRWAIGFITGERPPEPEPTASKVTGWFIEPINSQN